MGNGFGDTLGKRKWLAGSAVYTAIIEISLIFSAHIFRCRLRAALPPRKYFQLGIRRLVLGDVPQRTPDDCNGGEHGQVRAGHASLI